MSASWKKGVIVAVAGIALGVTPGAASANPFAVLAAGKLIGKIFHHSTTSTAQAQNLSSAGDNVISSKVQKMELERIRTEIKRDRTARKWKPLKQVKFLPANSSNL